MLYVLFTLQLSSSNRQHGSIPLSSNLNLTKKLNRNSCALVSQRLAIARNKIHFNTKPGTICTLHLTSSESGILAAHTSRIDLCQPAKSLYNCDLPAQRVTNLPDSLYQLLFYMSLRACTSSTQLQPRQRRQAVRVNAAQERPVTFYDPCVTARTLSPDHAPVAISLASVVQW